MFTAVRDIFSSVTVFHNDLWQWLISLLIVLGGWLVVKVLLWLSRNFFMRIASRTETKIDDIIFGEAEKPIVLAVILFSLWVALRRLALPEKVDTATDYSYRVLIIINVCWFLTRIIEGVIQEYLIPLADRSDRIDNNAVRLFRRFVCWLVWILGTLTALNNVGVNVGALLAGLGIGGMALALAAQDTIKNIFAGLVIFADRPFRIGDRIKVNDYEGYVEDIGIRSVRLRMLNRQRLTLSCSTVADAAIVNVTAEPARRIYVNLGLTYDTTPERMELALDILKGIPDVVTKIERESYAYFMNYGDFSLNLRYIYDIKSGMDYYETQSEVNLCILTEFNRNGLDFAFPTQTLYVKK